MFTKQSIYKSAWGLKSQFPPFPKYHWNKVFTGYFDFIGSPVSRQSLFTARGHTSHSISSSQSVSHTDRQTYRQTDGWIRKQAVFFMESWDLILFFCLCPYRNLFKLMDPELGWVMPLHIYEKEVKYWKWRLLTLKHDCSFSGMATL